MAALTGLTSAAASANVRSPETGAVATITPASRLAASTAEPATLRTIEADAQSALDAAEVAVAAASTVTADIAASGLDVGVVTTTVDTDGAPRADGPPGGHGHAAAPVPPRRDRQGRRRDASA